MINKFPPLLIMEKIHSKIDNLNKFPWYVLASPFFSKINDCQDSSFEYIAKRRFKEYKSTNSKDKLYKSIIKNAFFGFKTFFILLFKSQLKIKTTRKIKNKSLVVDYFKNKKTNNTILEFHYKNIMDPLIWIVDSNIGYDKELEKFSIFELFSFLMKIIISNFYLPYKELGLQCYLLEISRNFNMFYTFKYFLAGNDLKNSSVENLHFLYEDQPRDRVMLQNNIDLNTFGYIHTSFIHHWRLNKFYSNADVFLPNNILFRNENAYKIHLNFKFKNTNSKLKVYDFLKGKEKKIFKLKKNLNTIVNNRETKNSSLKNRILFYLPNNYSLSIELYHIYKKIELEFKDLQFFLFPHPNIDLNYNLKINETNNKPIKERDLIISSHRTNKGFELFEDDFDVIYFGSDNYSYYIPYNELDLQIRFAHNTNQLKSYLHEIFK